jgi:anion-transporting  ArsA/GET3 family ATPase
MDELSKPSTELAKALETMKELSSPSAELTKALEKMDRLPKPAVEIPKWLEEQQRGAMHDVVESARKAYEAFDFAPRPFEPIHTFPELPRSPVLETNERLEAVEKHAAGTREALTDLGKMVSNLGVLGAEIQAESARVSKRALWTAYVSAGAAVVAVLLVVAQVLLQVSDSSARVQLEGRIEQLRVDQARISEEAALLRGENAQLATELKRLQQAGAARNRKR